MKKKVKKAGKYSKETNDQIDEAREQLAVMLCSAAVSWKTGISFSQLMGNSVKQRLRPDDFWLEMADVTGNVMGMVEEVSEEAIAEEESKNATIN